MLAAKRRQLKDIGIITWIRGVHCYTEHIWRSRIMGQDYVCLPKLFERYRIITCKLTKTYWFVTSYLLSYGRYC
jgi:hypothetical protein